ncbi:c-type cytochrome [Lentisphaera profundi]|uniref:C-type cytochrome n=1 Tax=Lentisphaera profundi TaxID=1658616 RepID=A0ABY7VPA7_9BACT|nr:PVC-type heme-binding CxxCH protein [Lentisphaera profundi]WDE95527.1 c-type cytochrome [Lentisphaera profundi]
MIDPIAADKIPAAPVLDIDKALASFKVQEGFELEVVASEPQVFNPVTMVFDADGRMWICEMNTYMPNVDGTEEEVAKSKIVILEDSNGDGKVDKRTEFLNDITLPRAIAFVPGGILYADNTQLFFVEVLPGLKAGKRELVDKDYAKGGSVEHKPNTMLFALDNWYYNSKSSSSYRALPLVAKLPKNSKEIYKNQFFKLVKRTTENRGQWGLTMDDYGRLYHNGNSSAVTGEYLRPGSLLKNPAYRAKMGVSRIGGNAIYPIRMNPGINRGYMKGMLHADGKLKNFTAASGSLVYRGDQFPEKYYGMALTPEPAGNLISARFIQEKEGSLAGKEIYNKQELLASTDERFRPVNLYTAADGSIYILDIYHGILQHRVFVTSYLRKQILSRGLDKGNNERGRIYRLRSTQNKLSKTAKLSGLSASQLVSYLLHPSGLVRDTARQQLVFKQDKIAVPAIVKVVGTSEDPRLIINALWTLEGLGAVSPSVVRIALKNDNVKVRVNALAVAEFMNEADRQAMRSELIAFAKQANYEEALQLLLISSDFFAGDDFKTVAELANKFKGKKYVTEALMSGLGSNYKDFTAYASLLKDKKAKSTYAQLGKKKVQSNYAKLSKADKALFNHGKELFFGHANCFGCHGPDAEGLPNMGPPLVKSEWVNGSQERLIKVMLHGLYGPITVNKKKYNTPMPMPGLGANPMFKDKDIAGIATYIRNHFGNKSGAISEKTIQKVRMATKKQSTPYPVSELQ